MEQHHSFRRLLQNLAEDQSLHKNRRGATRFSALGSQPLTALFHHPLIPWMPQVALPYINITATFSPAAPIGEMPSFMGSSMGSMGSSTTPGVFPMESGSLFSSPTPAAAVSNSQPQEVSQLLLLQNVWIESAFFDTKAAKGLIHMIAGCPTFCLRQPGPCLALH